MEVQKTNRDSRTGIEEMTLERRLGEKSRIITKQRGRDGVITEEETLNNIEDSRQSSIS
jgi:hypothetical protein